MSDKALSSLTSIGTLAAGDTGDLVYVVKDGNSRAAHLGQAAALDPSDSPTFTAMSLTGFLDIAEIAAPAAPAANTARLYAVDDGAGVTTFAMKDAAANVVPLSHFLQAGTGAVTRTQQAKAREILSVADFGADGSGDDSALFQAAVNALPSIGGTILVPPGDYSAVVGASVDAGDKIVTWLAKGATTPSGLPGAIITTGFFDIGGPTIDNRSGDVTTQVDLGAADVAIDEFPRVFFVKGQLDDNGLSDRRELVAYGFQMETDSTTANGGEVRGMKGTVIANGGAANVRAVHVLAEGNDGHDGLLTGLLGTAVRTDHPNETAGDPGDAVAIRGNVGAGCTAVFEASSFNGTQRPAFGYLVGIESAVVRPENACFAAHGGGVGDMYLGFSTDSDLTKAFRVKNNANIFTIGSLELPTSGQGISFGAGDVLLTYTANTLSFSVGTSYRFDADVIISAANPVLVLTDIDTGADSRVSAASGAGSLILAADFNNEVAGSVISFQVDGAEEATLSPARFAPAANDGLALGTGALAFADLFLASGGVINWNNGNATLTHSTGLLTSSVPIAASVADAAAVPVLTLTQNDVDQDMIEFVSTIGTGNAIEAVGAKTLTTTHFIKVTLPGGLTRYFPVGTIA